MIRTVPDTISEEIELYMRTYYSLLRTTDAIKLQALVESHTAMDSALHIYARSPYKIDVSALIYCSLRLPSVIHQIELIVLGQLESDFKRAGYPNVEQWQRVHAPGRRRRTHFDGNKTLAVMIASRSDIDDIIPILTAFQIEWNKVYYAFQMNREAQHSLDAAGEQTDANLLISLAENLNMDVSELTRLHTAWKGDFWVYLRAMASRRMDMALQLLAGSLVNYRKATGYWWRNLSHAAENRDTFLRERPVYFVSSNTHSVANLLSGYATTQKDELVEFMQRLNNPDLLNEWAVLQTEPRKSWPNFYCYLLKKYQAVNSNDIQQMIIAEEEVGLVRVPAQHGFDVETQIIQLNKLKPELLDPRITEELAVEHLAKSNALIINIDYPLGLAAFELLSRVMEGCDRVLGVYVMGKAATLNGRIGDVMLVNVVHDEHSQNTYLFNNCFRASDVAPYLAYGTLLDNQKAVTARGTFLQNRTYMDVFYREGYTVLEMEAGPYLSAAYEMMRPTRHPSDEIVNLYPAAFDIGFIHYGSDTPFSKGHNLGAGSLGYQGMDSTYASTVAILRRIFKLELSRVQ